MTGKLAALQLRLIRKQRDNLIAELEKKQSKIIRYRQALGDIVRHQEAVGGEMAILSGTRSIALKALEEK
jgi:hypothetical protein